MGEAARKSAPVLMPDRMGLAEHKRHEWVVDLPVGVTLDMAMEPGYWAHVAPQMDPLDTIQVRAEDGSWVAWLIVKFCERNYATVVLDRELKLGSDHDVPESTKAHKVEWKGPSLKHCVIRIADGAVLHSGERDKLIAYNWMVEHEKALRR